MKHLNLQLEKLEQRIAPGGVSGCGGGSNGSNKSHPNSHANSHATDKSHGSGNSHKSHCSK